MLLLLFLVYCGMRTAKETGGAFACAASLGIIVMRASEKARRGFSDCTMIIVIMHRTSEKTRGTLTNNLSVGIVMNGTAKHSRSALTYNFAPLIVVDSSAEQTGFAYNLLCHTKRSFRATIVSQIISNRFDRIGLCVSQVGIAYIDGVFCYGLIPHCGIDNNLLFTEGTLRQYGSRLNIHMDTGYL